MTAIERTAYPRPGARLTRDELGARYSLSDTDFAFIRTSARGDSGRMLLATLLKSRQDLGYFATPDEIHPDTVSYLRSQMGLGIPPVSPDEERRTKTLYQYQAAVRTHLSVTTYGEAGERLISSTTLEAAQTMSDPADLINRAIEALHTAAIDLPAFSTLDRLVNRLRAEVHERIFDLVAARLTAEHVSVLEALLTKPANSATTSFNRLKQAPGPATPKTIKLWIDRLDWLDGALDPDPLLEGIAHTKLRQFAAEAAALEANDLLDISQPGKRHTLMLALLRQARMRGRDELIEMMLRRIRRTQRTGFHGALNYYRAVQPFFDLSGAYLGAKISQPSYFTWGKLDGLFPIYHLTEAMMRDRLPGLRGYIGLDGVGHWVQHEAAAQVNQDLITFARGV
jgi:pimeloyl-ACP methyl ester carboxylesterase